MDYLLITAFISSLCIAGMYFTVKMIMESIFDYFTEKKQATQELQEDQELVAAIKALTQNDTTFYEEAAIHVVDWPMADAKTVTDAARHLDTQLSELRRQVSALVIDRDDAGYNRNTIDTIASTHRKLEASIVKHKELIEATSVSALEERLQTIEGRIAEYRLDTNLRHRRERIEGLDKLVHLVKQECSSPLVYHELLTLTQNACDDSSTEKWLRKAHDILPSAHSQSELT